MSNTVLSVVDLFKSFPKVKAVNGISFNIKEGFCYGLLGPNGAGKTTTIEMLEGITVPDSGQISYRGQSLAHYSKDYKERIGIQFQKTALPDHHSVREVLELFQSFYKNKSDLSEISRLCQLEGYWDRMHDKLSGGQRQRLLLALALVNDPDVLFLDEPTTGLDPQARRNFWDLVQSIKEKGKSVVLTTHYMEEAYVLCDEVAIMDHGRIIAEGMPSALLKKHFDRLAIELPIEDLQRLTVEVPWPTFSRNGLLEIQTGSVNETLEFLIGQGIDLARMTVRSHNLEDLFLNLTGKDIRK